MGERSYKLTGREKWKTWTGREVEGGMFGVLTFFIKHVDSMTDLPKTFTHYYILREAIDKDLIGWLLYFTEGTITIETPLDKFDEVKHWVNRDRINIQLVIELPESIYQPRIEVRVDAEGKAFTTSTYGLVCINSTTPLDYKQDKRNT